ncbi:hypothetical protein DH2020_030079 [Rehmannia glutinosa]|uniref:ABC transporter domain-containing protein n=1 Tax=Rehmannia glutinosa TaxID=99300 RepID=A0ABR0VNG8_REHGL
MSRWKLGSSKSTFAFCAYIITLIFLLQSSFLRLVQCQLDELSPPQLPSPASFDFLTEVAYSRLENLTTDILSSRLVQDYSFCIQNPEAEWDTAFNYSSDVSFLTACLARTGDVTRRLCTAAEVAVYLDNLRNGGNYLRPNRNCNSSRWVNGCEPGWACSTDDTEEQVDLKNSRDIPARGLDCACPLGSYCPLATLNENTSRCEPYAYQLPSGQSNHTCGGANMWADARTNSEVFCSAGSYCPTITGEYLVAVGCFKLTTCDPKTESQNIHAYGVMLITLTNPDEVKILDPTENDTAYDLYPSTSTVSHLSTEKEDDHNSSEVFDAEPRNKNIKKKIPKEKEINTHSQIFKYAYSQLEREKAQQQQNKNLTFSGVISMATNEETRKRPLIEIAFRDLTVTLKGKHKNLLRCVTGKIKPGRITAIMGPSGAGKTTFLSALAGKAVGCMVNGLILINGKSVSIHSYRKIIGFVPQDDIVHGNLTVEENLWFSARCRLSADLPKADKVLIVERVIDSLGLQAIRGSLVGTVEKRGISGGQRKRVNVGVELVMEPSLLFLDEPTSGLDSSSSQLLLRALRREALEGVNICMVVHQPSYTLFQNFDDLVLLAKGGLTVYHGPNFLLGGCYTMVILFPDMRINTAGNTVPTTNIDNSHEFSGSDIEEQSFAGEVWQDVKANVERQRDRIRHNFLKSTDLSCRRTPSIVLQYKYFLGRVGKQRMRAKTQAVDYLILLIAGACLGSLTKASDATFGFSAYTFTIIAVSLLCKIAALRSFSQDKLQYWRESASGISSLAHFVSKDTVDLFNTLIKPVVYLSMFYFFSNPRSSFASNYIVLLCLVYCVTGIAYALAIFLEPGPSQLVTFLLLIANISLSFDDHEIFNLSLPAVFGITSVVLTLISTQLNASRFVKDLANFCYPKWALEAFVIANAERYYGVWLLTRCGALMRYGYNVHHWPLRLCLLVFTGAAFRVVAFIGMVTFQKK